MHPAWLGIQSVCLRARGELEFRNGIEPRTSRPYEAPNGNALLRHVRPRRGAHLLWLARLPNPAGGSGKSAPRPSRLHVVGDGGRPGRLAPLPFILASRWALAPCAPAASLGQGFDPPRLSV